MLEIRQLLFILVGGLLLAGCIQNQIAQDPPAGHIPPYVLPIGESRSLLADTGRSLHGHTLVAENSNFAMYLYEPRLSLIIQDLATGEYMRSTVAEARDTDNRLWQGLYLGGVTLDYIVDVNVHFSRACLVFNEHEMTLFYREDGFSAQLYFPEIEIGYTLIVTLTEDGFTAEIPQSSIHEGNPDITVGSFYVFPFLGHSYLGEHEGYMFIPDGQGAIINLRYNEGRFNAPFSEPVFGRNVGIEPEIGTPMFSGFSLSAEPEMILMPVYGMVHTDRRMGFLAVIESGYENAYIEAFPNGVSTGFDWVSARFIYSHIFHQPTGMASGMLHTRTPRPNRIDVKMRFIFVGGDQATYAGLAVSYREFLYNSGAFRSAVMDDFRIGIDFLGVEQRDWALFRLNVNMTTFRQAEEILRTLAYEGVTGVYTRFDGWTSRGSMLSLPTRGFDPASSLGGERDLRRLRNTIDELGGDLTLVVNPLDIRVDTNAFESLNAMRRITGRTAEFSGGNWRITSPPRTLELSERTARELGRRGFVADIVRMPSFLTAYSEGGAYHCRTDSAVLFSQSVAAFENFSEYSLAPALTSPFAYLWQYARALTSMPSEGSGYLFVYRTVPFLSIATSGQIPVYLNHVNFQPNQRRFFLNLVETGARPMFLITEEDAALLRLTWRNEVYSSTFELYKSQIVEYNMILSGLHSRINGASIVRHYVDGNVVRVVWSNGVEVFLNYSTVQMYSEEFGIEIEPLSFVVIDLQNRAIHSWDLGN